MRGLHAAGMVAAAGLWACQPNAPVKVAKLPPAVSNVVSNAGGQVVGNNGHQVVANNSGSLTGVVRGPAAGVLANNGGNFLDGGAALVANNGGGYRLAYADADVAAVPGAGVALADLQGHLLAATATTGADGRFTLKLPADAPAGVVLRASYTADGRALTLVAIAPGSGAGDLAVDPASTLAAKQLAAAVAAGKLAAADASPALAGKLAGALAPFMSARAAVAAAVLPDNQAGAVVAAMSAAAPALAGKLADAAGPATAVLPPAATPTPAPGGPTPTPAPAALDATLSFARGLALLRAYGDDQGGSGAGTSAATTQFKQLNGLALAPDGRLFAVDAGNHQIRLLGSGGATVLAGDGSANPTDGPLATHTGLQEPVGLLYDPRTDALCVADAGAGRIRKFAIGGGIHALAGGGVDTADQVPNAANAALGQPWALAADQDENLYFTDRLTGKLRRLERGGKLTTLATFTPFKAGPMALDAAHGRAWVGDSNQVRLVAGLPTAPAPDATPVFDAPGEVRALAYDPAGRLYVLVAASGGNQDARLWRLALGADGKARGAAEAVAGSSTTEADAARFSAPLAALADARQQPLAGAGACSLLVDLRDANDPAKAAGQLYLGSSVPGRFGQLLRLTPAE